MKPSRHRLIEGGLGEVIPAELLQEIADFTNDSVDELQADHARSWRGMPSHEGLRWPRAVALLEIVDPGAPDEGPETRTHFSWGFKNAPEISSGRREVTPRGVELFGWWLDWRVAPPYDSSQGMNSVQLGVTVGNTKGIYDAGAFRTLDLGVALARTDEVRSEDAGKGLAFLGQFDAVLVDEEWEDPRLSDHLKNLKQIALMIR